MAEQTKKKGLRWQTRLLLWAAVLLLLGGAVCFVLYRYLAVYEVTRPEPFLEQLLLEYSTEDWQHLAEESLNRENHPFEDAVRLFDEYCELCVSGHELTYREEMSERTADRAVYVLRAGTSPFCKVTLSAGESAGFGRHSWQLDSVSAEDTLKDLDSLTLTLYAPEGSGFCVNGVTVDESFLTSEAAVPEGLTELELRFDTQPTLRQYTVGPLYGSVVVTDLDGNVLSPAAETENEAVFTIMPDTCSLQIIAPADAHVTVCGAELTASDAVSFDNGIFTGLEEYTENQHWLTAYYRLEGLLQEPEVTVTDPEGQLLVPIVSNGERLVYTYGEEEVPEEYLGYVRTYFDYYIKYSAWGTMEQYNNSDKEDDYEGYYGGLLGRTLYGTRLYDYIANSYEAMIWASGTSTSFDNLQYSNFCRVSDRCFTCTVTYTADMTATAWTGTYDYSLDGAYEFVFVNPYGAWIAAAMEDVGGGTENMEAGA